jgi:hypothetical protein
MAAEFDFDGGREPAKFKVIVEWTDERCLRQIHLGGDSLHAWVVPFHFEQTAGGGVASKRAIREGINDQEFHVGFNKPKNNTSTGFPSRKWWLRSVPSRSNPALVRTRADAGLVANTLP